MIRPWLVLALLPWLGAACGDDDEPEPPPADLVADVTAMQELIGDDTSAGPLEEVDDMVAEDRPVAAADLLAAGAIPAARRHLDRVRALSPTTPEGTTLHRDLVRAYEARLESLRQYETVLERGTVEDLALVEALAAQREATQAILDLDARLAEIRPLPEPRERRREVRH